MYALRKMKRTPDSRVTGTSTRDGRVFAWVKHAPGSSPGSRDIKVPVNSLPSLQEFSLKYMAKDASEFIDIASFCLLKFRVVQQVSNMHSWHPNSPMNILNDEQR